MVERERRVGQHDTRWVHLLGPVPEPDEPTGRAPSTPAVDRDSVIGAGPAARDARVVTAYDEMADAYADALLDELDHKPFDRWLLERIAADAAGGPVVDAGCGPGHVAFHLAAAGAEVVGVDLSPGMVAEARRRFPDLTFRQGDLTDLPAPDDGSEGWSAIVAWYSLVHLAGSELAPAIALMSRRLRPGGTLAVALHVGDEVRHVTELFGRSVDVDFVLHDQAQVLGAVATAGLDDLEWYRRGPVAHRGPDRAPLRPRPPPRLTSSRPDWRVTATRPGRIDAPVRGSGQPRKPLVMGRRRSLPNALSVTRGPGGDWRRLYSATSTRRVTRRTTSGSWPSSMISAAVRSSSM